MLWADANVQAAPAKELIAEAIDLVVQVGFRLVDVNGEQKRRRRIIGVWAVNKEIKSGNVGFTELYHLPGDDETRTDSLTAIEKQFLAYSRQKEVLDGRLSA
jgi:hypothetical protein